MTKTPGKGGDVARKPRTSDAASLQELRRKMRPLLKVKFPPPLDEQAKSAPPLTAEEEASLQDYPAISSPSPSPDKRAAVGDYCEFSTYGVDVAHHEIIAEGWITVLATVLEIEDPDTDPSREGKPLQYLTTDGLFWHDELMRILTKAQPDRDEGVMISG